MHTNYITTLNNRTYCFDYYIQSNGEVYYENLQQDMGNGEWERVIKTPKGFKQHLDDLFSEEIEAALENTAAANDAHFFNFK